MYKIGFGEMASLSFLIVVAFAGCHNPKQLPEEKPVNFRFLTWKRWRKKPYQMRLCGMILLRKQRLSRSRL